jgi:two-component system phosphate regulon sensor histidine kinase PhoR
LIASLAAIWFSMFRRLNAVRRENDDLVGQIREITFKSAEEIEDTRDYYDVLLDQIPVGVIIVNHAGKIHYANKAAEHLLITPRRNVKKSPLSRFSLDFELAKQIRSALDGSRVVAELTIKKPAERVLRALIKPVESDGRISEAIAVLEDVTELRRLETARRELVTSFSHELRTPIAANRATLEALLDMGADQYPAERERFLKHLRVQTEHLSNLVTEMLQLSHLETGEAITKLKKIAATEILDSAVSAIEILAEAKDIVVRPSAPPDLIVKADKSLLTQAMINLLDNAIKYTKRRR